MNTIQIHYYKSPVGELLLGAFDSKLCICDWRYRQKREMVDARLQKGLKASYAESSSDIIDQTIDQLNQYFAGQRNQFTIPLLFVGTPFQQKVWGELQNIPFGVTDTYIGLSTKLNNKAAVRAVAAANGANALSIIVPCHRIIGSNGELVGYAGGLSAKKKLLQLEGVQLHSQLKLEI